MKSTKGVRVRVRGPKRAGFWGLGFTLRQQHRKGLEASSSAGLADRRLVIEGVRLRPKAKRKPPT